MKKILLVLGFLLSTAGVLALLLCDSQLFAATGCCKKRDSLREGWRTQIDMTLEDCKRQNERSDRDNVFDERGLVWWDVRCR